MKGDEFLPPRPLGKGRGEDSSRMHATLTLTFSRGERGPKQS